MSWQIVLLFDPNLMTPMLLVVRLPQQRQQMKTRSIVPDSGLSEAARAVSWGRVTGGGSDGGPCVLIHQQAAG